ncbi:hypothetical protein RB595_008026 [Gaeumannomyces hyphopodioides]
MAQLFSRRYLRRTATAAFIVSMSQLSGASVIQNFQAIFYETVGFTGRQALLISGVYGMMGAIGMAFYLAVVADRWPRVRTLWMGSLLLSIMIAVCMALSAVYGSGSAASAADAGAGARGAIAMIFIYSATFAVFFNAMVWVVPSELFPFFLRSKGLSLAVTSKSVVAIASPQITPVALADISWRFYTVFIATNLVAGIIYFFFLPETSGKTLEEIAELFGDTVATRDAGKTNGQANSRMSVESVRQTEHKV